MTPRSFSIGGDISGGVGGTANRIRDRTRSSDRDNSDKKRPFQRPFSRSRLESISSTTAPQNRMASPAPSDSGSLMRQNNELRQRLADESSNYRRRLETYKQAQNNQAALVSRLQAKVLQYKQRCSELEQPTLNLSGDSNQRSMSLTSNAPIALPPQYTTSHSGPLSLPPCPLAMDTARSSPRTCIDEEIARRLDEERRR